MNLKVPKNKKKLKRSKNYHKMILKDAGQDSKSTRTISIMSKPSLGTPASKTISNMAQKRSSNTNQIKFEKLATKDDFAIKQVSEFNNSSNKGLRELSNYTYNQGDTIEMHSALGHSSHLGYGQSRLRQYPQLSQIRKDIPIKTLTEMFPSSSSEQFNDQHLRVKSSIKQIQGDQVSQYTQLLSHTGLKHKPFPTQSDFESKDAVSQSINPFILKDKQSERDSVPFFNLEGRDENSPKFQFKEDESEDFATKVQVLFKSEHKNNLQNVPGVSKNPP